MKKLEPPSLAVAIPNFHPPRDHSTPWPSRLYNLLELHTLKLDDPEDILSRLFTCLDTCVKYYSDLREYTKQQNSKGSFGKLPPSARNTYSEQHRLPPVLHYALCMLSHHNNLAVGFHDNFKVLVVVMWKGISTARFTNILLTPVAAHGRFCIGYSLPSRGLGS